jgi:hypothetical protein
MMQIISWLYFFCFPNPIDVKTSDTAVSRKLIFGKGRALERFSSQRFF